MRGSRMIVGVMCLLLLVSVYSVPLDATDDTDFTPKSITATTGFIICTSVADFIDINNLTGLDDIRNDLNASYRLVADIDASATSSWNSGLGFLPIGSSATPFNGVFEGNGHSITNLYINRTQNYVGLFATSTESSYIANLSLMDFNISGGILTGGLVGYGKGTISGCTMNGNVIGGNMVGGLAGRAGGGSISECFMEGTATSTAFCGGLIGSIDSGTLLTNSSSIVQVYSSGQLAGGLVGENNGVLYNCSSIADVIGLSQSGGLIGKNNGNVTACHSEGTVNGSGGSVGGLIGKHIGGTVSNSSSSVDVIAILYAGGLIGQSNAPVERSFATGNVIGSENWIGGLIGTGDSYVNDCFATGSVNGGQYTGGFIGNGNSATIRNSYSVGMVSSSTTFIGGFSYSTANITACFWNTDVYPNSTVGIGKNTSELMFLQTFLDGGWDFDATWWMADGHTYPLLTGALGHADAGHDQNVMLGTTVDFNASTNNYGQQFYWSFQYDGINVTLQGMITNHTFQSPGVYIVHLYIEDSNGSWSYGNVQINVLHGWQPTITTQSVTQILQTRNYSYLANANESCQWSMETNASFLNLNTSVSGFLVYGTPSLIQSGVFYINISATSVNGYGTAYQNFSLVVIEAYILNGVIRNPSGEPIAGLDIFIDGILVGSTDENGSYEIAIGPGDNLLEIFQGDVMIHSLTVNADVDPIDDLDIDIPADSDDWAIVIGVVGLFVMGIVAFLIWRRIG